MVFATIWGIFRILFLRPRVIVSGNDMTGPLKYEPRMARVYEWLRDKRISYINLIHAAPHGNVVRRWFRREEPVIYLEVLEYLGTLSWFFRVSGASYLWAIDDYRHWPRVILAAQRAKLRTTLFQHGRFNKHQFQENFFGYSLDSIPVPDCYVVWNKFWQRRLLDLSNVFLRNPEAVRVGGRPSQGGTTGSPLKVKNSPPAVLFIHEEIASPGQVASYLDAMLSKARIKVFYKIRPDLPINQQTSRIPQEILIHERFEIVTDIPNDISLAVGSYSTLLYELIERGMPIGVLRMDSTQADDLVEEGLAVFLDPKETDIGEQIRRAAEVSGDELKRRVSLLRVTVRIEDTLAQLFSRQ